MVAESLERDFLNYNASLLTVLKEHRLLRAEEEEDLRRYLYSF